MSAVMFGEGLTGGPTSSMRATMPGSQIIASFGRSTGDLHSTFSAEIGAAASK